MTPLIRSKNAFSLVELLVVVALIGLITFMSLPSVTSMLQVSLGTATRELASVTKEAYNSALMTGKVYRLAYDIKESSFWVESGPTTLMMDTQESKEREERRKRFARLGEEQQDTSGGFSLDKSVTRTKKTLPRGVGFEDVITEQSPDPITDGIAYTHIFPHGLTEQTIVHLKDSRDHQSTLILEPLTGRTRLVQGYLKKEDVFAR